MVIFQAVEALAKLLSESGRPQGGTHLHVADVGACDAACLVAADKDFKVTSRLSILGDAIVYETVTARLHGVLVTMSHPRKAESEDVAEHAAKMRQAEDAERIS